MRKARKNKGILIFVMGFILLLFVFDMVFFSMVRHSRDRIMGVKNRLTAGGISEFGLDYAVNMVKNYEWKPGDVKPCPGKINGELEKIDGRICLKETFQTPIIASPGGYCEISLYSFENAFFHVKSAGFMGREKAVRTRDVDMPIPANDESEEPTAETPAPDEQSYSEVEASPSPTPEETQTPEYKPLPSPDPYPMESPIFPPGTRIYD